MAAPSGIITDRYDSTGDRVLVGDAVMIDGHPGIVKLVCQPSTEDARAYSCEVTGGLLLDMEISGLTLEPFGTSGYLTKSRQ